MLQLPIFNSELIEIPLPATGPTQNQVVKFPKINRLTDVIVTGFACYDSSIMAVTPSGYDNIDNLDKITVDLQNKIGMSPYLGYPANGANPLYNFGFSQDINPMEFDSSKSSIKFSQAVVTVAVKAFVLNVFYLEREQYNELVKRGFFKSAIALTAKKQ